MAVSDTISSQKPVEPYQVWIKENPATGEPLQSYLFPSSPQRCVELANEAVYIAKQAQVAWENTPIKERAKVLKQAIEIMQGQAEDYAGMISHETGKPVAEALQTELLTAIGLLRYYASVGVKILSDAFLPLDSSIMLGRVHQRRYIPRGVVGVISPWNYPWVTPISGIGAALISGNAVVLKPSEWTPATGLAVADLFAMALEACGHSRNLIQCLSGDSTLGQALCQAPVDFMIFTGGTQTGKQVRQTLQQSETPLSLELGGSDPMIVLESANLEVAMSHALWGRFANAGQTCAATKRLFVPKQQYEEALLILQSKAGQLKLGAPDEPGVHLGPVINQRQQEQVLGQINDALALGARLITGGKALERPGYFIEPTILADVPPQARVLNEEVFGPALPVIPYISVEEAITMANNLPYGLTASVFGKVLEANEIGKKLEAGCVAINDTGSTAYAVPAIAWRGWKASGPGGSHGKESLLELCKTQTISINWFSLIPALAKQVWHFNKATADPKLPHQLAHILLNTVASKRLFDKLNPRLLQALWANRGERKI